MAKWSLRVGLIDHTAHDSFDVDGQRYISMRYTIAQQ